MRRALLIAGIVLIVLVAYLTTRRQAANKTATDRGKETQSSSPTKEGLSNAIANPSSESPFLEKSELLKRQGLAEFDTLLSALRPFGQVDRTKTAYVQYRTNRQKGVNIEVEVRSGTHKAVFGAGPINPTNGVHINPFLPDGLLLSRFESLDESSDTRRNPDAMNTWYQATNNWTEADAVRATFGLMERMGIPTNQVVRNRFNASSLTVKDPSGNAVRATPFFTVEMCKSTDDDYSSFLRVEYRLDQQGVAKITQWRSWPPVKVP